jgi:hypothetical protein
MYKDGRGKAGMMMMMDQKVEKMCIGPCFCFFLLSVVFGDFPEKRKESSSLFFFFSVVTVVSVAHCQPYQKTFPSFPYSRYRQLILYINTYASLSTG